MFTIFGYLPNYITETIFNKLKAEETTFKKVKVTDTTFYDGTVTTRTYFTSAIQKNPDNSARFTPSVKQVCYIGLISLAITAVLVHPPAQVYAATLLAKTPSMAQIASLMTSTASGFTQIISTAISTTSALSQIAATLFLIGSSFLANSVRTGGSLLSTLGNLFRTTTHPQEIIPEENFNTAWNESREKNEVTQTAPTSQQLQKVWNEVNTPNKELVNPNPTEEELQKVWNTTQKKETDQQPKKTRNRGRLNSKQEKYILDKFEQAWKTVFSAKKSPDFIQVWKQLQKMGVLFRQTSVGRNLSEEDLFQRFACEWEKTYGFAEAEKASYFYCLKQIKDGAPKL